MEFILQDSKEKLDIFENISRYKFNKTLVHQITVAYAADARQGTKNQKSRAEVTGSNKKPWRQKGTGRARAGSTKSPIWRSGGVTFASKNRDYHQKINKKMYRKGIKIILSELIRQNRLIFFKKFFVKEPKTKLLIEKLKEIKLKKILIIVHTLDNNLLLSSRNLYKVNVSNVLNINPISLINSDVILLTLDAAKQIEKILI